MVFSFFGLPKYLSVKNKKAFIHSFIHSNVSTDCLPCVKHFYTINSPTRPVKRSAMNRFLDSMTAIRLGFWAHSLAQDTLE